MRRLTAVCFLLMSYSPVAIAGACTQQGAEKYIRNSENAWAESVATSDASVVKRILSDDFVWVLDGRVLDKAQAIADAEAGPNGFKYDHVNYIHIRFYGNTAVAQGSESWARKKKGVNTEGKFVWTGTWVCRNGAWQIVSAEDISISAK